MSIDLTTNYLGHDLKNPLVAGACPLTGDFDALLRMQEAGAAAVVLPSLFQEQLERDERAVRALFRAGKEQFAQVLAQLPGLDGHNSGPAGYLRHIQRAKAALAIPVIGSLSGAAGGGWARHARLIEEAGADALELNVYFLAADAAVTAEEVEKRTLDLVAEVVEGVTIPVAVKLGPFFSALPNLARRLEQLGAEALVLFNRFLQPDIDLDTLQVRTTLPLTTSADLRLPLRWIAILRPQLRLSLAGTTGVHTAEDLAKLLLAGADVVMLASALLLHGPAQFRTLLDGLTAWLAQKGYSSLAQVRGLLSQANCTDMEAFERESYLKMITSRPVVWV